MTDEIIRLREELVGMSSDPIKTRVLLDKLTEEEILQHDIESLYHVSKNDIEEEKDFDFYKVCKTRNGYLIHYRGGYTVYVDEKMISPCSALEFLMGETPNEGLTDEEKQNDELMRSAIELVFRLPMFVFSHSATTYNIATLATRYLVLVQQIGGVPTEETENEEYDKFIVQVNEMMDNWAKGIEKEGKEWERRNRTNDKEEVETKGEGQGSDREAETEHS